MSPLHPKTLENVTHMPKQCIWLVGANMRLGWPHEVSSWATAMALAPGSRNYPHENVLPRARALRPCWSPSADVLLCPCFCMQLGVLVWFLPRQTIFARGKQCCGQQVLGQHALHRANVISAETRARTNIHDLAQISCPGNRTEVFQLGPGGGPWSTALRRAIVSNAQARHRTGRGCTDLLCRKHRNSAERYQLGHRDGFWCEYSMTAF